MPQQDRSSQYTQGGLPFVARNALPSRFSASTVASSGPSRSSKSSQQLAVGVASFSPGPRPSFSTSRRASLASSAPSNLPAVAEDRTLVVPPPVPSLPTPHRTSRPGTFGAPPRDLTLVEAALSGDMEAARVALARGETPGKRDSEGRDALMGCVAGWAVLKHFNKGIVVRTNSPEQPDPFSLFLEILPNPSITLWTLNATYPVVQTGTLLTVACWLEKVDFVRALMGETFEEEGSTYSFLRGWVDPDGPDARGGTGLMYSAVSGHLEIAQLLLSNGARPDQTENSGLSAIWHATGRPQMTWLLEDALRKSRAKEFTEIVKQLPATARLISLDPELHYSVPQYTIPPPVSFFDSEQHDLYTKALLRAVRSSDVISLENLLFPSSPFTVADVDIASSPLSSPVSSTSSRKGVVGLVNFVDENGLSPLHHALRVQPAPSTDVIKLLFAAGADVNLACLSRSTPLHHLACLGGASPESTRRNFTARQKREEENEKARSRTTTSESTNSSRGTKVKSSAEFKTPVPSRTVVPSPAKPILVTPADESPKTEVDLSSWDSFQASQVRQDPESFTIAPGELEARLRDVVQLVLRFGASTEFTDCSGALPLHFAAEFGSSREIVRALLMHDLDEEVKAFKHRLMLPQKIPERVSARDRQNGLGLTPRDLCRIEFVDLFDMASQESKSRRAKILEEHEALSGVKNPPVRPGMISRGTTSSSLSSQVGAKQGARDSILQPLAPLTSLEDASANLEQICDNLLHVDKSLASGLLLRLKEDLAQQNSSNPEPDYFPSPLSDPMSEGIARLRRSFQTDSKRNSFNRFRPVSIDSTQSSWWSQPSSYYSSQEVSAVRYELDGLYRLFVNTSHMIARCLQFYSNILKEEDDKLHLVEDYATRSRDDLDATADMVDQLENEKQALRVRVEEIETDRHNAHILSQVSDLAAATTVALSNKVQRAIKDGVEDLELVRHIKAATAEAVLEIEQMKVDIADIDTGVAADACRLLNNHLTKTREHSSDLIKAAVLYQSAAVNKRKSLEFVDHPGVHHRRASSSSSSPGSPLSSTFSSPMTSKSKGTDVTTPSSGSRGKGPISEHGSSAGGEGAKNPPLPAWLRDALTRKEDQEEYTSATSNIEEIERDERAVEAEIKYAEENEVLLQSFIDKLPKRANTSKEANERREAFRLMAIVFQQLDDLRLRRNELLRERQETEAVLKRFEERESRQDSLQTLSSLLKSHILSRTVEAPPRATRYDLVESQESEDVSFAGFQWGGGPRKDVSRATEADVAWDLRKVALKVEGAEGLLLRMREDYRLVLKAMAQNRSRCNTADKNVRDSTRQISTMLQWRMDSIIVLWEYVSADCSDDDHSNASSWILDSRDRHLLPDLISDPLPLRSTSSASTTGTHTPPLNSPDNHSAASEVLSASATSPTSDAASGMLELTFFKQVLKHKVHEPLRAARQEVHRVVEWCDVLRAAKERLEGRLRA